MSATYAKQWALGTTAFHVHVASSSVSTATESATKHKGVIFQRGFPLRFRTFGNKMATCHPKSSIEFKPRVLLTTFTRLTEFWKLMNAIKWTLYSIKSLRILTSSGNPTLKASMSNYNELCNSILIDLSIISLTRCQMLTTHYGFIVHRAGASTCKVNVHIQLLQQEEK